MAMNKKILITIIIVLVVIGTISVLLGSSKRTDSPIKPPEAEQKDDAKPRIVTTKPDPLNNVIIPADQVIEITFNRPLENVGEFKVKIEPKVEFKAELSSDRKTAKIIPTKPFELGSTYTMSIGTETKFDGVGRWGEEKVFQFRTIKYRGI